ncbi:hypothetical protein ACFVJH_19385 [Streptomyces decoyicus]|uniref:hypothetical protein n=1 Tax=Streptomyces decoyicus TaxID=249567 RepID=UPI003639CA78
MTSPSPASGDMLLPPAMVEDPSPLRVSTFAKPEYAKLTFTYGKVKEPSAAWPVHCKRFQVRFRTGRQAAALTSEPRLIRYELTVPPGKRPWTVARDDRDPNEVIFTCSPPGEPAAFDGSWSVQLELTGIEVNGSPSPVSIDWEESTSATGEAGPYIERTGRGEVSKRDDSFYLHSFRPATVAINRGTKATLHWEGTPNADYTMYYRKPDGTEAADPAHNGIWTSPEELVDDTTFALQAKMGDETRYLTTYIKVNNPDIVVNQVTAHGAVDAQDSVTIATGKALTANGPIAANDSVTVALGKTLTTNGPIAANDSVTVALGKTLTTNGPIAANDSVTVALGKTLTANGDLTAASITRISDLRGPANRPLKVNSDTEFERDVKISNKPYHGLHVTRIYGNPKESEVTIKDPVKIDGAVNLMGKSQGGTVPIGQSKSFRAPTAGLIVGIIKSGTRYTSGMIKISHSLGSSESTACANTDPINDWHVQYSTTSALVRKGESVTITASREKGPANNSLSAWYRWYPFGGNSPVLNFREEGEGEGADEDSE